MNYEEKYKDALEMARDYYKANLMLDKADENLVLEYIFPELKELEDERIRKALIEYFNEQCDMSDWNGIYGYQVVAWLKKQGKNNNQKEVYDCITTKEVTCTQEVEDLNDYIVELSKQFPEVSFAKLSRIVVRVKKWLEKQGQQKPFDYENANIQQKDFAPKIEPKFKVGDWIVNKGHSYLIADIDYLEHRYLFEIGGYTHEQLNWEYIELADKRYHLWSIQDAKDGDVLADVYGNIGIIQEYDDFDWRSYCSLGCNGGFQGFNVEHENDKTHPATKEQRDLLFAKMHEAGYEWDEEKKELIKIEDEPENYKQQVMSEMTDLVKDYIKQKPAWSKEDERNLVGIIDEIEANKNNAPDYDLATYYRFLSWLKGLKNRYTWKPSNEQMEVLLSEVTAWKKGCPKQIVLESLYKDLKKLKRELL